MRKMSRRELRQAVRQNCAHQTPAYWDRIASELEETAERPVEKRRRRPMLRVAAYTAALAAVAVLAFTMWPRPAAPARLPGAAEPTITSATPTGPVPYHALHLAPVGDVKPLEGGEAADDILPFSESILANCDLLCEVTVTDRYPKDYRYDVASDKFEKNGRLHMQSRTTVFVLRLEEVLYGEAAAGETIRVEVTGWGCVTSEHDDAAMLPGRRYIVPLYAYAGKDLIDKTAENWVAGDVTLNGAYGICYPFAPQIEVTLDEQYLFHEGWASLIDAHTVDVLLDEDVDVLGYGNRLKLRADSAFKSDLCHLLKEAKAG